MSCNVVNNINLKKMCRCQKSRKEMCFKVVGMKSFYHGIPRFPLFSAVRDFL